MEEQFERERTSLEEQKRLLREGLESLREELAAKLNMANSEVMCALKHSGFFYTFNLEIKLATVLLV